ncbi:hypothetical protein CEXT_304291 [Caerostris extrusa]|uniref:Uncharacterized protein n=1 Tax=Caerostris extrusa TaxID=172846 RepID=A0AAV4SKH7_CAEEX|nr:hypothetical protein CEXT_304291 [Caerostris extrusa]
MEGGNTSQQKDLLCLPQKIDDRPLRKLLHESSFWVLPGSNRHQTFSLFCESRCPLIWLQWQKWLFLQQWRMERTWNTLRT